MVTRSNPTATFPIHSNNGSTAGTSMNDQGQARSRRPVPRSAAVGVHCLLMVLVTVVVATATSCPPANGRPPRDLAPFGVGVRRTKGTRSSSGQSYWISKSFWALRGGSSDVVEEVAAPEADSASHSSTFNLAAADGSGTITTAGIEAIKGGSNETSSNFPGMNVPLWKQRFPDILLRKQHTFRKLTLQGVVIYLLGTAHVSNDSCVEVQMLLETTDPDCVFVELCEARIPLLTLKEDGEALRRQFNLTDDATGNKESLWSRATALQQAQGSSRLQALSTVMLTSVQEEYAKDLGVELGGEFQAAYQFWKAKMKRSSPQNGSPPAYFVLGDRPMHLTLRRAWESLWWWPKTKVVAGLLWSCLFKPNPEEIRAWLQQVLSEESDILTKSFEEMRKHFPTLHRVIIQERDAYLAAKLTQTCQQLPAGSVVVALVGAGHVPGICSWLLTTNSTQTPEQVLAELVTTRQRERNEGDPEPLEDWIHHVTTLHEMPDESFAWAQPHHQ